MIYLRKTFALSDVIIVIFSILLTACFIPTNLLTTNSTLIAFTSHQAVSLQATMFAVAAASASIFQGHLKTFSRELRKSLSSDELDTESKTLNKEILKKIEALSDMIPQVIFSLAILMAVTFVTSVALGFDYSASPVFGYGFDQSYILKWCIYLIVITSYLFFYIVYDVMSTQITIARLM